MNNRPVLAVLAVLALLVVGGILIAANGTPVNATGNDSAWVRLTPTVELASVSSNAAATVVPTAERPAWQQIPFVDARTGEQLTLADFAGRTVMVEAFAAWCGNCRAQMQNVAAALPNLGENVTIIGLGIDPNEDAARLADHAERNGFTWLIGSSSTDLTRALIEQFGRAVTSPPSVPVFFIRPDGTTSELYLGIHSPEEIAALIAEHS